jgi:LuxR family maltose regulon positive regulatory protein
MPKSDPLIRTKLRLPFTRPGLVPRPRLQEQIAQGLRGPLTLITAPAGFGKTTLVASCIANCGLPVAWLSLDKGDNQAGRFLSYLVAALQEADLTIGSEAAQLLASSQQAPPEGILTGLINNLDSASGEIALVLDDYQFISSQTVHEAVAFLLEHCPNTFHLVIATRSDPPLPLARLRARGQTVELRAADLRFTEPEAAQFLNDVMGLLLDDRSVAALEERTEGWIAGLQMAAITIQSALSMRDRKDVLGFIEGFSGTNRYILDYLMEEVLASQSLEIQSFLLCTSILERLTAPLCDAITESREWRVESSNESLLYSLDSQSVLEYLERANLFLVPLDDERQWYRYHHLFADLLRSRLVHSADYEVNALHLRAADWFEQNGYPEDAIHHALAARDFALAARLIENLAETVWLKAEYSRLIEWVQALPLDLVRSRPWLCVWYAWSLSQIGLLEETTVWIEAAGRAVQKPGPGLPTPSILSSDAYALEYEIATLHALIACLAEDYDRAIQLAAWILENPPPQDRKSSLFARCHVLHGLSSMYYVVGELSRAEETSMETIRLSREIRFTLRHIHAANKLANVYRTRGQLHRSHQLLLDTLAFFEQQGLARYSVLHILRCRLVDLLYEWNRLEEIERLVEENGLSGAVTEVPYVCVDLYNLQARRLLLRSDLAGAQSALDQAALLIRQSYIWPALNRQTESLQVRLWLQMGDLPRAAAWASAPSEDDADRFPFLSESRLIARARILLAQSECDKAASLLDRLRASAESGGRQGSLVTIRTMEAVALQATGQPKEALAALEAALGLAETEGYIRTFVDEGQPIQMLLAHWLAHANPGPMRDYAIHLLSHFDAEPHMVTAAQKKVSQVGDLVEPLSQRELEVLHLIALGRTNQEIARQLIVAPGTIKAHAASIYRKLDVANRTEAVARARQVGILP